MSSFMFERKGPVTVGGLPPEPGLNQVKWLDLTSKIKSSRRSVFVFVVVAIANRLARATVTVHRFVHRRAYACNA